MSGKNPLQHIYDQLNCGTAREKFLNIPSFPLLLDIELTNHCNFCCRMCTTGMNISSRPRGYMSEAHFETILDAVRSHATALRFIRWGEPTLHPQWIQWMQKAKSFGIQVHFNTNGSLLTEEHLHTLVENNIDSIKFSYQGVDADSYAEMRGIDFFDNLMSIGTCLKSIRGKKQVPYIQISTTVTDENMERQEKFKKKALLASDVVNIGYTNLDAIRAEQLSSAEKKTWEKLQKRQYSLVRPLSCPEVFAKLSIDWDGTVTSCCGDNERALKVGHLDDQNLAEIWQGQKQKNHQALLAKNAFSALPLCKQCYISMPVLSEGE